MTSEGDFHLLYSYVYRHLLLVFLNNYWRTELCFFFRVIQNVIELKPKSKYILAVDDSKKTLEDIVKVTFVEFVVKKKLL